MSWFPLPGFLSREAGLFAGLLDRLVEDAAALNALVAMAGEFGPGAVAAIRSVRLERHGHTEPATEADHFAASASNQ